MVLVLQLMLKELDKFMIAQSQFLGMTLCQCNLQMLHFPQQGSIDDQLSVNSSFGMMHDACYARKSRESKFGYVRTAFHCLADVQAFDTERF